MYEGLREVEERLRKGLERLRKVEFSIFLTEFYAISVLNLLKSMVWDFFDSNF